MGRSEGPAGKRELAVEFIRQVRGMNREQLHELILQQAGEELARFFITYATELMQREPRRAAENGSSMLLIGYLIRCFEDGPARRAIAPDSPFLH